AQPRQLDRDHIQAIVEIASEAPGGYFVTKSAVGHRNDAHVDGNRPETADALDLTLLENPQQLALQRRLKLPDFIEEQRAPVGRLQLALLLRHRVGEGSALVSEQLRLDQRIHQCGAVNRAERLLRAWTMQVDGA